MSAGFFQAVSVSSNGMTIGVIFFPSRLARLPGLKKLPSSLPVNCPSPSLLYCCLEATERERERSESRKWQRESEND